MIAPNHEKLDFEGKIDWISQSGLGYQAYFQKDNWLLIFK